MTQFILITGLYYLKSWQCYHENMLIFAKPPFWLISYSSIHWFKQLFVWNELSKLAKSHGRTRSSWPWQKKEIMKLSNCLFSSIEKYNESEWQSLFFPVKKVLKVRQLFSPLPVVHGFLFSLWWWETQPVRPMSAVDFHIYQTVNHQHGKNKLEHHLFILTINISVQLK